MKNINSLKKRLFKMITLKDIKDNRVSVIDILNQSLIKTHSYIVENSSGVFIIYNADDEIEIGYHIYFNGETFVVDNEEHQLISTNTTKVLLVFRNPSNNTLSIKNHTLVKSKCSHLESNVPTFKVHSTTNVICTKCNKRFISKTYKSRYNDEGEVHVANDLTMHKVDQKILPYRYTYYIPQERYPEFKSIYNMVNERFVKVTVDGKEPKHGKYASIVFWSYYMYIDTVGPYHFENIDDVKFIYDDKIYGKPYVVGIDIITKKES